MAEAGGENWGEVTYLRKKTPRAAEAKSKKALTQAQRKGEDIETTKKYDAGGNKQKTAVKDTAVLDRETEELKHATVTLDFGRTLQQARTSKGLTQKELATKINEKPQVVNEYESGKAIPNQTIISKMERSLGIKLRGKDAGTPFGGGKKK